MKRILFVNLQGDIRRLALNARLEHGARLEIGVAAGVPQDLFRPN